MDKTPIQIIVEARDDLEYCILCGGVIYLREDAGTPKIRPPEWFHLDPSDVYKGGLHSAKSHSERKAS